MAVVDEAPDLNCDNNSNNNYNINNNNDNNNNNYNINNNNDNNNNNTPTQAQSNEAWGRAPVEVALAVGTLRILGNSFAICTGTLLRVDVVDGAALPLESRTSSPGSVGHPVDLLFKVGPEGVTAADLAALVAGVPVASKSKNKQGVHASTTFLEGRRPQRYPDVRSWSGGAVVCCTCERREVQMSSAGAIVLHATALQCIDVSTVASGSRIEESFAVAPKTDRHSIFACWIIDTFGGLTALLKGGVVDVAGGKGHLSNKIVAHGVPCTLVDPFAGLGRDPVAGLHCGDGLDGSVGLLLDRNVQMVKATLGDATTLMPGLITECSVVVALHPDEATEPAIDAARAAGRPFAVVPCCVFRKQFPGRLLSNGGAVVKYGNFLRYLREKDPRIRCCRLPFAGRNVVIYMTASDFEQPAKRSSTCFADLPVLE